VSAICLENTLTCGFSRDQFEQLVLKHPRIGLQVIKNLSDRVTWLTSQFGSLAVTNIEERLYRVLCNVAQKHGLSSPPGVVIQFPLTHEGLGFLTGAHRVSVTRAMNALKNAGKILLEDKRLILTAFLVSIALFFHPFLVVQLTTSGTCFLLTRIRSNKD